jgi:hypothetical protein
MVELAERSVRSIFDYRQPTRNCQERGHVRHLPEEMNCYYRREGASRSFQRIQIHRQESRVYVDEYRMKSCSDDGPDQRGICE